MSGIEGHLKVTQGRPVGAGAAGGEGAKCRGYVAGHLGSALPGIEHPSSCTLRLLCPRGLSIWHFESCRMAAHWTLAPDERSWESPSSQPSAPVPGVCTQSHGLPCCLGSPMCSPERQHQHRLGSLLGMSVLRPHPRPDEGVSEVGLASRWCLCILTHWRTTALEISLVTPWDQAEG